MKKFLVETVSMFRIRYVVECENEEHACDEVVMNNGNLKEFSQKHIDENIMSVWEIDENKYLETFDRDNEYLKDWSNEQKFNFLNKIDYTK